MDLTLTEIILLIGFGLSSAAALFFSGKYYLKSKTLQLTIGHNRTLYDLFTQNHKTSVDLLNSLESANKSYSELSEKHHKLVIENLELKHLIKKLHIDMEDL